MPADINQNVEVYNEVERNNLGNSTIHACMDNYYLPFKNYLGDIRMTTDYYILRKADCGPCEGKGIISAGVIEPKVQVEIDCNICEGKGYTFEPILVTEELLTEIRKNFLNEREGKTNG